MAIQNLILSLLIFSLCPLSVTARSFFILSEDDFKDTTTSSSDDYSAKWDEFDPGSWRSIFEPDSMQLRQSCLHFGARFAVHLWSLQDGLCGELGQRAEEAVSEIDAAASEGHACARDRGRCKGFCTGREWWDRGTNTKLYCSITSLPMAVTCSPRWPSLIPTSAMLWVSVQGFFLFFSFFFSFLLIWVYIV